MTATMAPSLNGVIRISKRSVRQFQFGDDQPVVSLDVVKVADGWHDVNFAMRVLENGVYDLPPGKFDEWATNRLNYVQAIVNDAYAEIGATPPTLTRGEAEEFLAQVREATEQLRNFIYPVKGETLSPPESTDRGTNFSQ